MNLIQRLFISTGAALFVMYIGDKVPQIVGTPQIFTIVYFPLFFFFGSLHNPFYGSVIIQGVAYICVLLFWIAVIYMIIWAWKK